MPIYEYRCLKCGHEMEVIQKFSDPPPQRCKECRGKLEKLISRASFQLKGGGWYAHGYGESGSAKPTKTDSKGKKGGGGSSADGSSAGGSSAGGSGGSTSDGSSAGGSGGSSKKEAAGA